MKNPGRMLAIGVAIVLGAGLLLTGCKSTPELTQVNALALIQAKYDQTPAVGVHIVVDDLGMRQGIAAQYWTRTTVYPNKLWADFTLTPEGEKALKLPKGGDVIQWRPASATDKQYSVILDTVAANPLKAHDVTEPQDVVLPGAASAKGATFTETQNLDGVPDAVRQIAHNPGNKLSTKRQAEFVLDGGAWKLQSIQ